MSPIQDLYDKNNIFAKIIRNEIPAKKLYEDEEILAFYDIFPVAKTHILVIPKGEYIDFIDFNNKASPSLIKNFFAKISQIAIAQNLHKEGFRIATNIGKNANQTVKHFHVHLLGGENLGGLTSQDKNNHQH